MLRRFVLLVSTALLLSACQSQPEKVTITISGGAVGADLDFTVAGTQRFMEKNPNVRVLVIPTPRTNSERLRYYQDLFSRGSDEVDVAEIDVVWTGILAKHALNLRGRVPDDVIGSHFTSIIDNNTVDGELVAMPWFADAPSLFYRTDLLSKYGYSKPPETWAELEEMATKIMAGERQDGNLGFWGYAFQGGPYEGLTCNALEWQYSNGGGEFVDAEGRANLLNEGALRGIGMGASWIGKISSPDTVNYDEEEARLVWQRGDVAFMRNWSYAYSLTKMSGPIGKSFAVTALPAGPDGRAATLGGWQLMVSRYSQHPDEAVALVEYLTSPEEQKIRAIEGSYLPTIRDLYSDPEILKSNPYFEGFEAVYKDLVTRPSTQTGAKYDQVSAVYSRAVYDILKGEPEEQRLEVAQSEINEILK